MARRNRKQDTPSRAAAPPARAPRSAAWWHLLLLIAVSFAVYGNALGNGFVSDDDFQVLSNKLITDYHNIPRIFTSNVWAFMKVTDVNYFRPLHMLTYMGEYYLFGYDPFLWHLANLGFHIAALLAAYFLVRALGGEQLALWAGLWFALHPIHVEAVVWVAVLTDLLCGLALFSGIYFYHRARTGDSPATFHTLALLAFLAGGLIKETALVFPALLIAYDYFFLRQSPLEILRGAIRYLSHAGVLGLCIALRLNALGSFAPTSGAYFKLTNWEMFLTVSVLFARYVLKLFLPVNLNYFYFIEPTRTLGWQPVAALCLIAALVVVMFRLRRTQPLLAFSLAWFFITLSLSLFTPIFGAGENFMTERYLYIPSFGFCIVAAWGWLRLRERAQTPAARQAMVAALVALFLLYSVQIIRRNPDWKDDLTLFSKTAAQSPDSASTIANLGYIHYLHGHVDESIRMYHRALELEPRRALTHNNLGNSLSTKGQFDEAIASLRRAIELKPDYYSAWLNLGLVYAKREEWDRAIECYQKSLELKPDFAEAWTGQGLALWAKKQPAEAMASYRKALNANPDYIEAHINLASALSETGGVDEAIEHLLAVLRIQPNGPHAYIVHYNLGVNYERKQLWKAAQVEYERSLSMNPQFPEAQKKVAYFRSRFPAEQPSQPLSVPRSF